jgi:hypothetical protein
MSGYIGTQPVPQATQTRDSFTATSGQTSFATSGYTPDFLDVFLNGVKLAAADYTASNGSDVVLATGATTGDILEVVAYTTFDTANVTGAANFTVTGSFTSQGIDDNATSTAMTLDASGNVLVGTTDTDPYTTSTTSGISLDANGRVGASYLDSAPMILNRRSSDGTIAQFRKDGTTVGSIASRAGTSINVNSQSGDLYLQRGGTTGLIVNPTYLTPGADATATLGGSWARFTDLYLSGGVFLGGTGAANKLSDYESGTFIPTFQSITNPTYVVRAGYYIKIGSFVSYQYRIEWSAGTSIGSTVNGLPFAARNGQDEYPMTSNVYHDQSVTYSSNRTTAIGYVLKNTANMDLVCVGSAQTVGTLTFSTSGSIYVTGQYYTNS